jgi:hypothetical protein
MLAKTRVYNAGEERRDKRRINEERERIVENPPQNGGHKGR